MLTQPASDHAAHRFAAFEECAVTELLPAISRNHVLNDDFARAGEFAGAAKHQMQFSARVDSPRLRFGGVKEMFFDGRLKHERKLTVDLVQSIGRQRAPRSRERTIELLRQLIGVALVEHPLHGAPLRNGYAEELREKLAMAREGSDGFVSRREQHPPF